VETLEAREVPSANFDPVTGRGVGSHGDTYIALTQLPTGTSDPGRWDGTQTSTQALTQAQAFSLHSRPNAHHVIFLDMDGNTTSNTDWNATVTGGADIVTPGLDVDGNPNAFSATELGIIQRIWQQVAEDYSPFDVDVTTQDPGLDRLRNTGGADNQWGVRAAIGGRYQDWLGSSAGGIAFVGSFTWDTDTPCFIFSQTLLDGMQTFNANTFGKWVGEATSHEVGHTLGLLHDGYDYPTIDGHVEYSTGFGTGPTSWCPIMGAGYDISLTQFSKGEYANASNTEDDLAIITSANGFDYRPDDHGDSPVNASPAGRPSPTSLAGSGVIERNTDKDVFRFDAGAGPVDISVLPFAVFGDLDIKADLYNDFGDLIASDNPLGDVTAHIQTTVPAGRYYLVIDGIGTGAQGTGYSDYGSLGQYSFTGTVPEAVDPITLKVTGVMATEGATGKVSQFRLTFNIAPDPTKLTPGTLQVTGPTGLPTPIAAVRPVAGSDTQFDVVLRSPQKFVGTGGVRVVVAPFITDTFGRRLNQDGDATLGEPGDFFAAATFGFNSTTPGAITDNGTTDFTLTVPPGRPLTIQDLSVRVNLTHPNVGDLKVSLVAPNGTTIIPLFDHEGGVGNNLTNTRFDDQATKLLAFGKAPFTGFFKPDDGALLSLLNGTSAVGTWKLRIQDSVAGNAGLLNSWGLTVTTSDARAGLGLTSVATVNPGGLVTGLTLTFN